MTTNSTGTGTNGLSMTVDGSLGVTMDRRRMLRLLTVAGTTAVVAGVTHAKPAAAGATLFTTTDLNLRAKPRSTGRILRVMPKGATVEVLGGGGNGYRKVRYNGIRGYAHKDYLSRSNGVANPDVTGVSLTTTDVNLRSGPSTTNSVLRVVPARTAVDVTNEVRSGFRYVVHEGLAGWIWDAYLGS